MFVTGVVMIYQGITGGSVSDPSGLEAQIVELVEKGFSYLGIGLTIVGVVGWFPDTPKKKDKGDGEQTSDGLGDVRIGRATDERMRNDSMPTDHQSTIRDASGFSDR